MCAGFARTCPQIDHCLRALDHPLSQNDDLPASFKPQVSGMLDTRSRERSCVRWTKQTLFLSSLPHLTPLHVIPYLTLLGREAEELFSGF